MTDIERAIKSCQDRKAAYKKRLENCSEYSAPKIMRQIELEEIKIAALKEREERSKVCTCWENAQKEIKIANGETFCSMCGKPLKEV